VATFTFASFGNEMRALARELDGAENRKIRQAAGREAQKLARRAAAADLGGDPAMSGWGRLGTKLVEKGEVTLLTPAAKLDAARWTVAQRGRNASGGIGGRFQGPGVNMRTGNTSRRRNGGITVRRRGAVRWNGVTRGKDTASDAWDAIEREVPKMMEKQVVVVMRRHFDVS